MAGWVGRVGPRPKRRAVELVLLCALSSTAWLASASLFSEREVGKSHGGTMETQVAGYPHGYRWYLWHLVQIMNQIALVAIRVQATSSTILPQSSGCIKDDLKNQARIQEQRLGAWPH